MTAAVAEGATADQAAGAEGETAEPRGAGGCLFSIR
jgi:hypothetical protein